MQPHTQAVHNNDLGMKLSFMFLCYAEVCYLHSSQCANILSSQQLQDGVHVPSFIHNASAILLDYTIGLLMFKQEGLLNQCIQLYS